MVNKIKFLNPFQILRIFLVILFIYTTLFMPFTVYARERFFQIQSIDTMKHSRDLARSKLNDSKYDEVIQNEVKQIKDVGATHVAISTPYDEEFLPYLRKWVKEARKNKLKVWFRGNLSGWEEWFEYPRIDRKTHTTMIRDFILQNGDLFEDGDVFSSCPECENGGPGDPRMTGDHEGFSDFIIDEYSAVKEAFVTINKKVIANYYSMNGDVARLIMDEDTTRELDGAVTIDHYVESTEQLENDIKEYTAISGGKIVLGEFGAPIPDIHGPMSQQEQAKWIDDALRRVVKTHQVIAINYWTGYTSSTNLWNEDSSPRPAVKILEKYYKPINLVGVITDEAERPIKEVTVKSEEKINVVADGKYELPVLEGESVTFSKNGYVSLNINVRSNGLKDVRRDVILTKESSTSLYSLFMKLMNFFINLLK